MAVELQTETDNLPASTKIESNSLPDRLQPSEPVAEKVLCPHCQRTATNGMKCKGICVADNDY